MNILEGGKEKASTDIHSLNDKILGMNRDGACQKNESSS